MLVITEEKGDKPHPDHNPNYHSGKDTVASLNLPWLNSVTRGLAATLGSLSALP